MWKQLPFVGVVGVVLLVAAFCVAPRRAEIRVDCGDVRYVRWGMVVETKLMGEPERAVLLGAVSGERELVGRWVPVVRDSTSYDHVGSCRSWYRLAARWGRVDPELCGMMVRELGGKIVAAEGKARVVPDWFHEFVGLDADDFGADWRKNAVLAGYWERHGG